MQADQPAGIEVALWQIEIPHPLISFEPQAANNKTCALEKQREPPEYICTTNMEDRSFHGSALNS